ncbi:MAG: DUF3179 domain-containing (seleno)protein [Acidobacteriota bacterium]
MQPRSPRTLLLAAVAAAVIAIALLAIPIYVIRPFVPQSPRALALALEVRTLAPELSLFCAAIALYAFYRCWSPSRWPTRLLLILAVIFTLPTIALTRVNIFERMFHPNLAPSFQPIAEAALAPHDMLLVVTLDGQSRGYPVRSLGYHHIINDNLANQPIAITYCTLCHTGLVWSRNLNGQTLTFRLAGINNGNALLRDEQTNSIWQQSTGESIFGKLKGQHLQLVHSDELSATVLSTEHPTATILRPDPATASLYDPPDWEQHVARTHVVVDVSSSKIDPHEIMYAVTIGNATRAYPLRTILAEGLIQDALADNPVLLVVAPDGISVRAFDPGSLTFTRDTAGNLHDLSTGSSWSANGCAIEGPQANHCLSAREAHKTFWFDWLNHHPDTTVYNK